ncbi:hypothetical protein BH18ACI4_BH18ACI4_28500 [soil metagenome]
MTETSLASECLVAARMGCVMYFVDRFLEPRYEQHYVIREGSTRWLMYRDWQQYEALSEEIMRRSGRGKDQPIYCIT